MRTSSEHIKNKAVRASTQTAYKSVHKPKFTDNSSYNQRLKILDWLFVYGSLTTRVAREELDIYSPTARVAELRQAGYQINTVWVTWTSEHGIKHKIGCYVLTSKQLLEVV